MLKVKGGAKVPNECSKGIRGIGSELAPKIRLQCGKNHSRATVSCGAAWGVNHRPCVHEFLFENVWLPVLKAKAGDKVLNECSKGIRGIGSELAPKIRLQCGKNHSRVTVLCGAAWGGKS